MTDYTTSVNSRLESQVYQDIFLNKQKDNHFFALEDKYEEFINTYRCSINNARVTLAEDHPTKKPHEEYMVMEVGLRDSGEG